MKHVGLNVAADPFMTLALTGVNAGLVVVSADDPGMHSSQNEQDNRHFAAFARVPLLEPSDSQEAYDFMAWAFELSEEFDTPVLLRSTTRLSHGRGQVVPRAPLTVESPAYVKDVAKYVMVPEYARERNRLALARLEALRRRAEQSPLNVLEAGTSDIGIIASGVAYTYAREAFPKAWSLKLGMSHPLPYQKVAKLYDSVVARVRRRRARPVHRRPGAGARAAGGRQRGHPEQRRVEPGDRLRRPRTGAQAPSAAAQAPRVPAAAGGDARAHAGRRPAGAPARAVPRLPAPRRLRHAAPRRRWPSWATSAATRSAHCRRCCRSRAACAWAPSIGMMAGMNRMMNRIAAVAVIGDSTFFHSGITPLIDARYNETPGLVIVLDNRTTAMTGHQGHPGTGLHPDKARAARRSTSSSSAAASACPSAPSTPSTKRPSRRPSPSALAAGELSVLVALAPCMLTGTGSHEAVVVDDDRCNLCGLCLELGCPAVAAGDESIEITSDCTGCGVCLAVCARGADQRVAAARRSAVRRRLDGS